MVKKGRKVVAVLNKAARHEDVWSGGGVAPSFLNAFLDGVLAHRGKYTVVPIGQQAGWIPEPVWTLRSR
jgi:hypothetical protein